MSVSKPQTASLFLSILFIIAMAVLPIWGSIIALMLLAFTAYILHRSYHMEQGFRISRKERLLILAPHQDDCVISAGGLALQTLLQNGTVKIVYLTQETGEQGERRRRECINSWRLAGLSANDLIQLNCLPELFE